MDGGNGGRSQEEEAPELSDEVLARLNSVLETVCLATDFVLAEALFPREDGNCLVQSSAFYLKNKELEGFLRASAEFVFPLQIGIPGRVWKHRRLAWHGNGNQNIA